ncbi:glutamyl-tRNA reductase [Rhodocytophaga rosea]|uniref:Glutamyl-tRNA reductase n=1 Tax=Rhodocytophaga rosea TaxID=2704465 RepID=A0A6C0GR99_9BACT|nr:glutamyl-tRNA reductase [Rhodocytophaga rosea]QHT70589.1 glutamyl-tRNA reductase [Rhodocytophaga rosea]
MHQHFKAISLSYKTAPLHIREMVALEESSCKQLLVKLKEVLDISEAIAVSTCNRTEVYYTSTTDQSTDIIKLLCVVKGVSTNENIHPYFKVINQHNEAVNYLFEVAIGIHSLVIGDTQISNQVKQAYQWSADTQMAGPFLHRLLHTIFFTNKKVVQETSFRDGAASVSYAAAELVEDLTAEISNPKILVLGLGEIGADVCKNLASKNLDITIANRTLTKAQQIAAEYQVKLTSFENVWQSIAEADVIISSIAKAEPFITRSLVEKLNSLSFKYFIDLSVPRSVENSVEELPGAVVYNIDDIQNKASEALQRRINAIPKVKQIIAGAVSEFHEWTNETAVSPTINKFKNALEQIRQEEIGRYMKQMSAEEADKIDRITKGMMQKIIKLPVLQLKAACKRGEAETLIDVLNDLFNLENKPEKSNL